MWHAVLGLVGVVLGGAIVGGLELRQMQLVTDRERQARQVERELARKDARDRFQRDTILALQDAAADLLRMVLNAHDEAANAEEKTGHWPVRSTLDELPVGFGEHFACAQGLRARVFDDELRRLVAELNAAALGALQAEDRERAAPLMGGLTRTDEQLQERINILLKELF